MKSFVAFALFSMLFVSSCSENTTTPVDPTIQTVKIGTQVWTYKNLDISTYRNGDPIRYASTTAEWIDAGVKEEGAWCYYNNDPKNGEKYGKLYNWWAVNDVRGLAPKGYHVPSKVEWSALIEYLGGEQNAGYKMKSLDTYKSNKTGWVGYNRIATIDESGNGDNSSGFNGLPGGSRRDDGNFLGVNYGVSWWSSTSTTPYKAGQVSLVHYYRSCLY